MEYMERMKYLVTELNKAARAYYQEDREIMSNYEYDTLYDELVALEEKTGTIFANSPTQNVGYEVLSELPKERHPSVMLSLDKTKEVDALADFLGNQKGILSWKMDGLTVVLTYRDGELYKAVTRGNGEIGEVITNNAKTFVNIPKRISYEGELVIRGEAVITYSDFEQINAGIADVDAKYKNPRNLCSGTVRQLNNEITAKRNVHFFAFNLVDAAGVDFENSVAKKFQWLTGLGFEVVEHQMVTRDTIHEAVAAFAANISTNDFPSDGLVLLYDDIAYGRSLGTTAKFPRDSIAFKWRDETAETRLQYIEWSPSRTGLINPVAVFDTVELEGTEVSRASVHNVSILEALNLLPGDEITVYKANMIIPQIAENLSAKRRGKTASKVELPRLCPACGGETSIQEENETRTLVCVNPLCSAKKQKLFAHFVSRNAMNIDGMSEMTIEKFIDAGYISELPDLYELAKYREEIVSMEGFGERSYEKLIASIEASKMTTAARLLFSLGVPNIGVANAKMIAKHFKNDMNQIMKADREELVEIEGVGDVMAQAYTEYFANTHNLSIVNKLLMYITFAQEENTTAQTLEGISFVVTGSLKHYENRDALKASIEKRGGKVIGSVSAKTSYLINNDLLSNSSKNKKAKELNIPIISEEMFIQQFGE